MVIKDKGCKTECENCNSLIVNNLNLTVSEFTVCDSCEATICIKCIGEQNECPVCGNELTIEDNF
jgi:hypothetical protein